MNRLFIALTFIILFNAIAVLYSCKKSKPTEDTNSPAYQIKQSESLFIPATVALPLNEPKGNSRVATLYAEGVQKYKAEQIAGTNAYKWVFVAPKATLYDATNKQVGIHSAGPTWQLFGGDTIYAQPFTPARTEPSPNGYSIDWLLLMPKDGKTATGIFSNVSYIQRIGTVGGKAPATPPTSATDTVDVKYTAIYRFSKKN